MTSPHEDFLFITIPYERHSLVYCYPTHIGVYHRATWPPIALLLHPTSHTLLVPWLYACPYIIIGYVNDCVAWLDINRLMCYGQVMWRRWYDYQEIVRPPTGGQLTSTLLCVMITTEAITNPYHRLPFTTIAGDLTKQPKLRGHSHTVGHYQSLPKITKPYRRLSIWPYCFNSVLLPSLVYR